MTLAEVCVRRPVFSVMLIGFLVVLGIFSFRDLGVDLFPKADPATVFVNVRLPGASPEEMVTQIVLPIEDVVSTISRMSTAFASSRRQTVRNTSSAKVYELPMRCDLIAMMPECVSLAERLSARPQSRS